MSPQPAVGSLQLWCRSPQSKQEIHRRSARLRNTKYKSAPAAEKKVSTKGKGRRHIFKLKNVRVGAWGGLGGGGLRAGPFGWLLEGRPLRAGAGGHGRGPLTLASSLKIASLVSVCKVQML